MKVNDFSSYFSTQLNSYAIPAGFGSTDNPATVELDEYEKSLFLTKSERDLVIDLYSGRNSFGASFEETEELRRYLANLIKEDRLSPIEATTGILGINSNSRFFTLPKDLMLITYEAVEISDSKCESMSSLAVIPARQDEYHKLKKNPFRGANDRRALRFDLADGVVEIVSEYSVSSYYLRYLRKLRPIVLAYLGEDQSIDGVNTVSECELPDILHHLILDRAVMLALQSRGYLRENNENR